MTADAPDLDYPMRVIREQAAALREAEAKLAAIRDVVINTLVADADPIVDGMALERIANIVNGKGQPTT